MNKAHLKVQMGGASAAVELYKAAPTPNVIVLETEGHNDILAGLDDDPEAARWLDRPKREPWTL